MPKIRKSIWIIAVTLGLLVVAGLYSYLFYFPWAGGYEFAQVSRLSNPDQCPSYAEVPGFDVGCWSYF